MKKLMIFATLSSCVSISAMAMDIPSYCPSPSAVHVKIVNGQSMFVGSTPGLKDAFIGTIPTGGLTVVGAFNAATDYLPSYHNPNGQIACNYVNGTLWLKNPTENAIYNNTNKQWQSAGKNAFICRSPDSFVCQFTVGE